MLSYGTHDLPIPVRPMPSTLRDLILHLPGTQQWAIQFLDGETHAHDISHSISSARCVAVSDGSQKDGVGTSAFTLYDPLLQLQICAVNIVPGPIIPGDSY